MKASAAMPIYRICITACAAAVLSLASACSDDKGMKAQEKPPSGIAGPLIVGVVGPMTGEEASYGISVVNGVTAAARRFNAQGGIGGQEIQVLPLDDESNIELTTRHVQDLIGRKVVAILAAPTGSSTFAPIHLVNDSKTIFISIGSRRHLKAAGRFVFRHAVPDEMATEDLIGYAVKGLGYINFALVTAADNDYSLDLSSMFRKALIKHGGNIKVQADSYDTLTGGRNLGVVIAALKKSPGPLHGVIYTGGASEGILLAQEMRKAGFKLPMIGGEDLFSDEFLASGDAVNGTLLYASFSPDKSSPRNDAFLKDYGNAKPDRFAALAYDTFMLLADAIKAGDSTDAAKIKDALINRKDFEGATGKVSFSPENLPIKHPLICRIEETERGERRFVVKPGIDPGASAGAMQSPAAR